MSKRDLLKEAIADAKTIKETAIANAKQALEETFTPYLKEKLSAKLAEMEEAELSEEDKIEEYAEIQPSDLPGATDHLDDEDQEEDEEMNLDELLKELNGDAEDLTENQKPLDSPEEEVSMEDMSEDDLKSFIEDVIKDMVESGELEAGEEVKSEKGEEEAEEEEEEEEVVELDELLKEIEEGEDKEPIAENFTFDVTDAEGIASMMVALGIVSGTALAVFKEEAKEAVKKGKEAVKALVMKTMSKSTNEGEDMQEATEKIEKLNKELNEINVLNAKLLYTNKIFRSKNLSESQKLKVLSSFDKAKTKQEVELVYETINESLKTSTFKTPIKESLGSASKSMGSTIKKPIIEDGAFARMQELAFGKK